MHIGSILLGRRAASAALQMLALRLDVTIPTPWNSLDNEKARGRSVCTAWEICPKCIVHEKAN